MELALRPLLVSILEVFPALFFAARVFSKELTKLYRIGRGEEVIRQELK